MADLDPARATFVQSDSRYLEKKDTATRALYPSAKPVTVESTLSKAIATALAEQLLNETKNASEAYSVTVEGIYKIEDLIGGGPARYAMTAPLFNVAGRVMTLTAFGIDPFGAGTTTVTVRG